MLRLKANVGVSGGNFCSILLRNFIYFLNLRLDPKCLVKLKNARYFINVKDNKDLTVYL